MEKYRSGPLLEYLMPHLKTFISSLLDPPNPSLSGIDFHCPVRGDHLEGGSVGTAEK